MGTVPDVAADFFSGSPTGLAIFLATERAVRTLGDDVTIRVTKSQITFRRRSGFAYVWRPGRYVRSEPASISSGRAQPAIAATPLLPALGARRRGR
ncbi:MULTISPECIES: DUF5655 domain-containing protein [Gordonia]|nr:DUF5655 domain-containing protein [Gordonia sp. LAM0048]